MVKSGNMSSFGGTENNGPQMLKAGRPMMTDGSADPDQPLVNKETDDEVH